MSHELLEIHSTTKFTTKSTKLFQSWRDRRSSLKFKCLNAWAYRKVRLGDIFCESKHLTSHLYRTHLFVRILQRPINSYLHKTLVTRQIRETSHRIAVAVPLYALCIPEIGVLLRKISNVTEKQQQNYWNLDINITSK